MNKIKIKGTWKNIEKAYTKVAGHWKEIKHIYLKENGKWVGTEHLPLVYDITVMVTDAANASKILSNDTSGNITRTEKGKEIRFTSYIPINKGLRISGLGGQAIQEIRGFATNMKEIFKNWDKITIPPDLTKLDTSKTTNMDFMFYDWSSLDKPLELGVGIEDFNIESLESATGMLNNTPVSTALYDAILTNWSAQNFKHDVTLDIEMAKYTNSTAITACRQKLFDAGWTIHDGGHN